MQSIYIAKGIQQINNLYGSLLFDYDLTVKTRLSKITEVLWEAFQNRNEVACIEINNYHPDYLGQKPELLFDARLKFEDIQKTIASEYGFQSWDEVEGLKHEPLHVDFERAVDQLLDGNIEGLKFILHNQPQLIHQKSQFGHGATLLHYVGSNGLEIYRQKVPMNLSEMTQFLLESGANKEALMSVYGGEFTALQLLLTSAHPYDAGVIEQMKLVFSH